jgi:murein DD-endopeptidase MepM/ murein hydrolase activator NlpD
MAMDPLTTLAPMAQAAPELPKPGTNDKDAAKAFEAYLVGFLASQMRSSVKGGPFNEGSAAMFADLFDQEIGKRVAESGGFGLQDAVERALGGGGGGVGREATLAPHAIANASTRNARPHAHEAGLLERAVDAVEGVVQHVTSGFGTRARPIGAGSEVHPGVDLGAPAGTPIRAVKDGVVRYAGARGGYGNCVIIDHGDGTETRYAHCATVGVAAGAPVRAGEDIATVGSTGLSTGPHLHFELRVKGVAVDPSALLQGGSGPLAR